MGIEIPNNIIQQIKDNEPSENVILLAMSILSKIIKNIYVYHDRATNEDWYYECQSQLAPDTECFLSMIDANGRKIDRIVILATPETLEKTFDGKSAVDFYIDEITRYASEKKSHEISFGNKESDNIWSVKKYTHIVNGQNIDENIFKIIELEKEDAFLKAVNHIIGNADKKINLYIDVQGGFRASTTQINAITELLDSKGVEIKARFANDYKPAYGDYRPAYKIHSVNDEYATYRLVTAMEMFKKYGRGEGLQEYFSTLKAQDNIAKKLAEVVSTAANSIQLCDVDGFDKAVDLIGEINKDIVNGNYNSISPELRIIYDDIWEDYSSLINTKYRYVEQIRWCVKKNFVQQALTILEAKMPTEYVRNGMKYYCKQGEEDKVLNSLESICKKLYWDTGKNKASKEAYKIKNIPHYYINYYDFDKGKKALVGISLPEYSEAKTDRVENSINEYKRLKQKRNNTNHAHSVQSNKSFQKYMAEKYPNDRNWKNQSSNDGNIKAEIEKYLDEWVQIADGVSEEIKTLIVDLN